MDTDRREYEAFLLALGLPNLPALGIWSKKEHGCRVIVGCRSQQEIRATLDELVRKLHSTRVKSMHADGGSTDRPPPTVDLLLRKVAHARALFPLVFRTPVCDTLIWDGPASEEEYLRTYPTYGEPGHRSYTVVEAATGTPVGALAIRPGAQPLRGDIGYWVGIPFQGRGYATSAVARSLEIAFGEMGMEKVEASPFVGNLASRRVLEKNGFVEEGCTRKAVLKRGKWLDGWVLGITREDWEARHRG